MKRGVVAAGHEVTAAAAADVLAAGGNAFDAVIAAFFAACVAEPVLVSLGGGGFLNARAADGSHRVYDFFAQTPRRRLPDSDFQPVVADFGNAQQEFHIGLGSAAVPGAVRGLFAIHRDLGHMPVADIVAPALAAARDGIEITPFQGYLFSVVAPIYAATPAALRLYGAADDPSRLVRGGDRLRSPELGELIAALAAEGDALFYRGELAARIDAQCRAGGGHLRRDDFERYEVVRRTPLEIDYRDARVVLNPPPSSGGLLIAFGLELLKGQAAPLPAPGTAAELQLLASVMGETQAARVALAADGTDLESARLLSPALLRRYREIVAGRRRAFRGTTHFSVMDSAGNVAALTASNGEGCGHVVPDAGFMLNNMLGEEDLHPAGFDAWRPDQRLTSMMCPTLLFHRDGGLTALGSGGSNRIRTALLQVLSRIIDHGQDLQAAVGAPRVHYENGLLSIEGGHPDGVVEPLMASFAQHHRWDERNLFFGGVHAVSNCGGELGGCGDPRRDGVVRAV